MFEEVNRKSNLRNPMVQHSNLYIDPEHATIHIITERQTDDSIMLIADHTVVGNIRLTFYLPIKMGVALGEPTS